MDNYDEENDFYTREEVINKIKSSIYDLKADTRAEFIMRLLEFIDDEFDYKDIIHECDTLRFELL